MYKKEAIEYGLLEPLRIYIREASLHRGNISSSTVLSHMIEIEEHLQKASKDCEQRDKAIRHLLHTESLMHAYIPYCSISPIPEEIQAWTLALTRAVEVLRDTIPVPKVECKCKRCGYEE